MASSRAADSDVTEVLASSGLLFENISFWLSSTVPQRSRFKEQIEQNGGKVVKLEKDADYRLVDHTKKDIAPGTYSFQFAERSIRNGKLEDSDQYRAGPSNASARPVGSTTTRPRNHRTPFTVEDDQQLYDFVKPFEKSGGPYRGNQIYQQLEAKNPRHSYQSWRSRYLTKVRDLPRPVTRNDAGRSPPNGSHDVPLNQPTESDPTQSVYETFTKSDKKLLVDEVDAILEVEPSLEDAAWSQFAEEHPQHSAKDWKTYFHTFVRPEHVTKQRRRKASIPTSNVSPNQARRTEFSSSANKDTGTSSQRPIPPDEGRPSNEHNDEMPVNKQSGKEELTKKSEKDEVASLKRKRRHTASENIDLSAGRDLGSPSRKRRATDHITHKSTSAPEGSEQASLLPESEAKPVHVLHTERRNSSYTFHEGPSTTEHLVRSPSKKHVPSQSSSISTSGQEEFETAPDHPIVRTQVLDVDDVGALLDTTIPDWSAQADEPDEDKNDIEDIQELDKWVKSRVKSGKVTEKQVIEVLRCTTMDPDLADKILPYLKAGKDIPTDMRGVWTAHDDDCIEGTDARAIEQQYQKHGQELAEARAEYLQTRRMAML